MRATYRVRLTFDTLLVSADLTEASAPIQVLIEDEDEDDGYRVVPTPYQTADARHDERQMARLAVRAMGGEYWQDPSIDYSDIDEDEAIDGMIVSVEAV